MLSQQVCEEGTLYAADSDTFSFQYNCSGDNIGMVYVACQNSVVAVNRLNAANTLDQAWTSVLRWCTIQSSPAMIHINGSVTVVIACTSYENGSAAPVLVALNGLTGMIRWEKMHLLCVFACVCMCVCVHACVYVRACACV